MDGFRNGNFDSINADILGRWVRKSIKMYCRNYGCPLSSMFVLFLTEEA